MAATIGLYAIIGVFSRTSVSEYYVAGRRVPAIFNGMATGAAPALLARFQAIPSTRAGKKAESVIEKAQATMERMVGRNAGHHLQKTLGDGVRLFTAEPDKETQVAGRERALSARRSRIT